jgi:hypothetical protein
VLRPYGKCALVSNTGLEHDSARIKTSYTLITVDVLSFGTLSINTHKMSSGTFVDRIDPFAKRSLKKKTKKSQGSSRYRNTQDVELQALPLLKGKALRGIWLISTSSLNDCGIYYSG